MQLLFGLVHHLRKQTPRTLFAKHRHGLQQRLCLGPQPVDAGGQHPLYRGRELDLDPSLLDQGLAKLLQEERIPLCLRQDPSRQVVGHLLGLEHCPHHTQAILGRQRRQGDLSHIGLPQPG